MTKISIVTVSFDQGKYLEEAIRSIVGQDYPALEYIVVDPGSTDGSREIIKEYSDRIAKIIFEPDRGPADGLNKGFSYATGDVFGYINADDILLPGALAKVSHYFDLHEEVDVVLGNGVQINAHSLVCRRLFSSKWNLHRLAYGACVPIQQATFFRKSVFQKSGGFNIGNRTSWDGELLVDMSIVGARFSNVPHYLGGFRIHPQSISGSGKLLHQYRSDKNRMFRKITNRNRGLPDMLLSLFYRLAKKVLRVY